MSTPFEIPLSPNSQEFAITLAGVEYRISIRWNRWASAWVFDLSDASGTLICGGIQMVAGADLFAQHPQLNLGGMLIAQVDNDVNAVPDFAGLGTTGHLYFVTP